MKIKRILTLALALCLVAALAAGCSSGGDDIRLQEHRE